MYRFQPASVPRQPFMSRLGDSPQTDEDALMEPAAAASDLSGTADLERGPRCVGEAARDMEEALEQAGETTSAGGQEHGNGCELDTCMEAPEIAAETNVLGAKHKGAHEMETDVSVGEEKDCPEYVGTLKEEAGVGEIGKGGNGDGGVPATPFAAVGAEFENTEPTQLECLERLPLELLADAPAESPPTASIMRTSRGVDRSHSKGSLSRFAPEASLSRQTSTSSVSKTSAGAAPSTQLDFAVAALSATPSAAAASGGEVDAREGRHHLVEAHSQMVQAMGGSAEAQAEDTQVSPPGASEVPVVTMSPPAEAPSSPAITPAVAIEQDAAGGEEVVPSFPPTALQNPLHVPEAVFDTSKEQGAVSTPAEPKRVETSLALESEPLAEAVTSRVAQASAGAPVKSISIDTGLAAELAALAVPCQAAKQAKSPLPVAEPLARLTAEREEASSGAPQPLQSRLRRPESTKLAPRTSQPIAAEVAR
jgi:hypothetical protein